MPSRSTQIQMGGGSSIIRNVYSWRYELSPTQSGRLTIGPARVRANGRELRTIPVAVTVHAGDLRPGGAGGRRAGAVARARAAHAHAPAALALRRPVRRRRAAGAGAGRRRAGSFVRAAADKTKVYVGEQVVVEWLLYLTDRQDKYQAITEPRTDGFWSEELTVPHNQGSLALTQQMHQGRLYLVAPLTRKALFPLQAGKLTITPLESEISQVDFFGRTLRTERLKAQPLEIEVMPLPSGGPPRRLRPGQRGPLRHRRPRRPQQGGGGRGGHPAGDGERAGQHAQAGAAPAGRARRLEDLRAQGRRQDRERERHRRHQVGRIPAAARAARADHHPAAGLSLLRSLRPPLRHPEDARPAHRGQRRGQGPGRPRRRGAAAARMGGLENVLSAEIRPPRTRPALRRDLGATLYRSPLFVWALAAPPALFGLTVVVGRLRERWGQDTERGRRRKTRRLIRHHLRAAEAQLEAGRPAAFYIEIDRVLREVLTAPPAPPHRRPAARRAGQRSSPAAAWAPALADAACCPSWTPATGPASPPAPSAPRRCAPRSSAPPS